MNDYIAHIREGDGVIDEVQSLEKHLSEVSDLCGKHFAKFGLREFGELIGLLHDMGKATELFLHYIKSNYPDYFAREEYELAIAAKRGDIDHSTAAAQFMWKALKNCDSSHIGLFVAQIAALLAASHHSGLIDCLAPDGVDRFNKRLSKSDKLTRLTESQKNIGPDITLRINELFSVLNKDNSRIKDFLSSLLKKEMGISGAPSSVKMRCSFKTGLLARMLFSCLIDADRTNTADFEKVRNAALRNDGRYVPWDILIGRFENHMRSYDGMGGAVCDIRRRVSDACCDAAPKERGISTLTVPTGGGKTLSSLRYALYHAKKHNLSRVFYILPYTTIIEQNADAVRAILEEDGELVVLEHHSNLTEEKDTWQSRLLSENWDAPIVFTTNVQFLNSLFDGGTTSARRMHQLARSMIVFDEIQTLPIRTVHLFCNALNFLVDHCESSALLCTATLPLLNEVSAERGALRYSGGDEIVRDVAKLAGELKRVSFYYLKKPGGYSNFEIAKLAIAEQKRSGTVLVVVNTTKAAREIYKLIKGMFADTVHLSARMCPAHRSDVLETVKKALQEMPQRPLICVATQVIEAGVDVDFGAAIRSICGMDSIMQTAGRVNRHGLRETGRVLLLEANEENLSNLRDLREARAASLRIFDELYGGASADREILLPPQVIERYFELYFYSKKDEMTYPVNANSGLGRSDNLLNMLSNNVFAAHEAGRKSGNDNDSLPLAQSFASANALFEAIDSKTVSVIVPYGKGNDIIKILSSKFNSATHYGALRDAQRYSINIYPEAGGKYDGVIAAIENEAFKVHVLIEQYYNLEYGLDFDSTEKMKGVIA